MGELRLDLSKVVSDAEVSEKEKKEDEKLQEMTAGKIDVEAAKKNKYRKSKKVLINFSIPEVLKYEFMDFAVEQGFFREKRGVKEADQKAFFLHCLRKAGMDIPDDDAFDSRKG